MLASWIFVFGSMAVILHAADWSYEGKHGPKNWYKNYKLCKGTKQSPIDIITSDADFRGRECISLKGYDRLPKNLGFTLLNNGHSAQVTLSNVKPAELPLSVFGEKFEPWQFHFHWGSKDEVGSEHQIDGDPYPAEMHFVHVNTKYRDTKEALKHQDGLLVLGTFIKIGDKDNSFLQRLLNYFKGIEYAGQNVSVPAFKLSLALDDISRFYYYEGSLTTPECNQAVQWIVFEKAISMSERQMAMFRKLKHNSKGKDGKENKDSFISDNFRPIQNINNRRIYRNFPDENEEDVQVDAEGGGCDQ